MEHFIEPFSRMGMWVSSHSSHYTSAHEFRRDYELAVKQLLEQESELERKYKDIPDEHRGGLIFTETNGLHHTAYRYATAAHLFSCMAIEGFINYYGIKRLGDPFYRRNLERLGITEKLSTLLLACGLERIDPSDELIKKVRSIFDRRNSIVHPKSKEVHNISSVENYVHPSELPVADTFEALGFFVSKMCSLDDEINKEFEFRENREYF
ncbi:MAG TPA: hypothetical protein DEP32_17705 [Pseudomonas sp.]|nr:hypothetical protein [Pseudomonas sp.]MAQ51549.1 hypothetical protein [Pseudomonas sp.]MBB52137.1 hypothetical protein [Pseudomonadales bacterium]MBF78864.1 hypothetical protein [Pseudomonadales bacterium]HCA26000.1 hypothetical protein [Pseudomonas sp.]